MDVTLILNQIIAEECRIKHDRLPNAVREHYLESLRRCNPFQPFKERYITWMVSIPWKEVSPH